jgi:hypothetical protein
MLQTAAFYLARGVYFWGSLLTPAATPKHSKRVKKNQRVAASKQDKIIFVCKKLFVS